MPKYIYTAKVRPEEVLRSQIEAESKQDAINKLSVMGYFPISIYPANGDILESNKNPRLSTVPRRDIIVFTRQLFSLTESGVNILTGLNIIAKQTSNRYLRAALEDIVANIKEGKPLSSSLKAHGQFFPPLYTALIHSGEVSGNLDQVLKRLADFLEKEESFQTDVKTSLAYPVFILFVSILTIGVLLGFIVPKLAVMFKDMGESLPLPTRMWMGLSSALRSYWWLIALATGLLIFFKHRIASTEQGRFLLDKLRLKCPFVGEINLKKDLTRLTNTLSLLLSSGVTIVNSLEVASAVVENTVLRSEIAKFREKIASGASFSQCLRDSRLFPELVTNIIRVGEESGNLEKALGRIADEYEREIDRSLKVFLKLFEPSVILAMGLVVGFIVISMLLPIFQINLTVK